MLYPVILCGGSGTRLWPLSRELYPKQFADLGFGKTLFRETLDRAVTCRDVQKIFVVCNQEHRFFVAEDLLELSVPATVLLEPCARNTAPAAALAAHAAHMDALVRHDEAPPVLLILPSDHKIWGGTPFATIVSNAVPAAQAGKIVTFGILASTPTTGYGYIKKGALWTDASAEQEGAGVEDGIALVERFIEKPEQAEAEHMLQEGGYFWNSGIFLVRADVYLQEVRTYAPAIGEAVEKAWEKHTVRGQCIRVNAEEFTKSPSDSIDYSIMMHTEHACVAPFNTNWSDLGSWDALYETREKNENQTVCIGDVIQENVHNSYLHSENRLIAALDVQNLVIVATRDAVFVAPRSSVQKVKSIVADLKEQNRQECRLHPKVYRPWGSYETLAISDRFQVKRIVVHPNASLSLQMHYHRAEHWVIVSGTAEITNGETTQLYTENQSTYIPVGRRHRLKNPGKLPLVLIEIQSGSYLGEDDIVRFEDLYQR